MDYATLTSYCILVSKVNAIEQLVDGLIIDRKAALLRQLLAEFRRHNSIDTTDPEYYGIALLNNFTSYVTSTNLQIGVPYNPNDPLAQTLLTKATRNDNVVLRMLAFYFSHIPLEHLEAFATWCEPIDHFYGTPSTVQTT